MSPELYVFSFTSLIETFSKCYEKVREKLYSDIWKTMEFCPFINIIDLLILKQSDTDKHIEHLEEIVKALIDDTKILQTKINTLESQTSLFKPQDKGLIDDKLLQRIESTILKQNEIDMHVQKAHSKLEIWNNALKQDNKKLMEKIGLLEKEITILKNIPTAVAIQTFSVGEEMLYDV
jgi:DNA-binding transcriptional regulator WhiA